MSNWQIKQNCPQCGGPAVIEETHRLFKCGYCKVSLFIVTKDYLRYYIVPKIPESSDTIYIPYWRFKGIAYSCVRSTVVKQIVERSYRAIDDMPFPFSLGLRPQTLQMRFVPAEHEGIFIMGNPLNRDLIYRVDEGNVFMTNMDSVFHRGFIGDCVNIVYAPYKIMNGSIYDSITARPLEGCTAEAINSILEMERCEGWQIRFMPALCPDCGWDLQGEGDTIVLPCRNCHTLWDVSGPALKKVKYYNLFGKGQGIFYLPFWRLDVGFSSIVLESYSDLFRIANLPKVYKRQWDQIKPYFWCPAFKVTPEVFLRLTRHLTLTESVFDLQEGMEIGSNAYNANLSLDNALESVKITLANVSSDRKDFYPRLKDIEITLRDSAMVYLPFRASGSELIQEQLKFSIHSNTLKTGRRL